MATPKPSRTVKVTPTSKTVRINTLLRRVSLRLLEVTQRKATVAVIVDPRAS